MISVNPQRKKSSALCESTCGLPPFPKQEGPNPMNPFEQLVILISGLFGAVGNLGSSAGAELSIATDIIL